MSADDCHPQGQPRPTSTDYVWLVEAHAVRRPRLGDVYVADGRLLEATPNRLSALDHDAEYPIIGSVTWQGPRPQRPPCPRCGHPDAQRLLVVDDEGRRYCAECYGL